MNDLKPCPFCGGINIIHSGFRMYCHTCGAEGPDADNMDESAAIAAWNRRAQPAQAGAEPVAFLQFLTDVVTAAGLLSHGKTDKVLAARISNFAIHLRAATQPTNPTRVPLTDKEIKDCIASTAYSFDPVDIARAAIAAYEAKNDIGSNQ